MRAPTRWLATLAGLSTLLAALPALLDAQAGRQSSQVAQPATQCGGADDGHAEPGRPVPRDRTEAAGGRQAPPHAGSRIDRLHRASGRHHRPTGGACRSARSRRHSRRGLGGRRRSDRTARRRPAARVGSRRSAEARLRRPGVARSRHPRASRRRHQSGTPGGHRAPARIGRRVGGGVADAARSARYRARRRRRVTGAQGLRRRAGPGRHGPAEGARSPPEIPARGPRAIRPALERDARHHPRTRTRARHDGTP